MADQAQIVTIQDQASARETQMPDEGVAILTDLLNRAQKRSRQRQAAVEVTRANENARALYNRD
jgi:molybdopterin biosynthesis enzyme MoaB